MRFIVETCSKELPLKTPFVSSFLLKAVGITEKNNACPEFSVPPPPALPPPPLPAKSERGTGTSLRTTEMREYVCRSWCVGRASSMAALKVRRYGPSSDGQLPRVDCSSVMFRLDWVVRARGRFHGRDNQEARRATSSGRRKRQG